MASVEVKVDINDQHIKDMIDDLADDRTLFEIHNLLYKMCDPYVPFLEGPLSQTAEVSAEGVLYAVPYARYQYYGDDFHHTTERHPLASARWDEAMMRDHGDEFKQQVTEILRRRAQLSDR